MIEIIIHINGHDIVVPSHFLLVEDEEALQTYLLTQLEEIEKKKKSKVGV